MWAISDRAYVYLYRDGRKVRVHIPKGHLFIFAADLVHAGMDYPEKWDDFYHFRMHCLLKVGKYSDGGDAVTCDFFGEWSDSHEFSYY